MSAPRTQPDRDIVTRTRDARGRTFGPRGAARCARALGINAGTYRAYERTRAAPVSVLVRISQVTGVDLRWLLTGQFVTSTGDLGPVVARPRDGFVLGRFADVLGRTPGGAAAMTALFDLLDDAAQLEPPAPRVQPTSTGRATATIPVLGRTAAGVPCFWIGPAPKRNLLDELVQSGRPTAHFTGQADVPDAEVAAGSQTCDVRLSQFPDPVRIGPVSVTEFITAGALRRDVPDAFALRVDGDSMSPVIEHGDLVIVSPSRGAQRGRPAVLQLRNQMGVTCKLYRPAATRIHLIPINESFPVTRHAKDQLVWALAVLYRIRLGARSH